MTFPHILEEFVAHKGNPSPLLHNITKRQKKIFAVILLLILAAAVILYIIFWQPIIDIQPQPKDAQISIDGHKAIGKIRTTPGVHKIKISASGYIDWEKSIKMSLGSRQTVSPALKKLPVAKTLVAFESQFLVSGRPGMDDLIYLSNSGKTIFATFPNLEKDGKALVTNLTADVFSGVKNLIYSSDRQLAIYQTSQGTTLFDFHRYDLVSQTSSFWNNLIGDIVFSPDSSQVLYYYADPQTGEKSLIKATNGNQNMERVADLREQNLQNPQLVWSADGKKALIVEKDVYIFDIYTKTLSKITDLGNISEATFTPDSQKILYFSRSPDPTASIDTILAIMEQDGKNKKDFAVRTSLEKMVITKDSQRAYADTGEGLFKINLITGEKLALTYDGKISAQNLVLSSDEKKLYLTEDKTCYIMELEIATKEESY